MSGCASITSRGKSLRTIKAQPGIELVSEFMDITRKTMLLRPFMPQPDVNRGDRSSAHLHWSASFQGCQHMSSAHVAHARPAAISPPPYTLQNMHTTVNHASVDNVEHKERWRVWKGDAAFDW
jgi:hypothetical protein